MSQEHVMSVAVKQYLSPVPHGEVVLTHGQPSVEGAQVTELGLGGTDGQQAGADPSRCNVINRATP